MGTLVVQAHPVTDSLSGAMLDAVVARLKSTTDDCDVVRVGQGDVLTADACLRARQLVAIYPTWWGSLPAMLLDQLNQVIGPWVDGDEPAGSSPLRNVHHIQVVTSHGSSRLINRMQGEPGLQLWKRTLLPLCASNATFDWQSLYKLDRLSDSDRTDFLSRL